MHRNRRKQRVPSVASRKADTQQQGQRQQEEPPSMLSVLSSGEHSSNVAESSLLILDAYEHRIRKGQTVSPASLKDLRRALDKAPCFAGSLDVTLRLLDLEEQVLVQQQQQQHEAKQQTDASSSFHQRTKATRERHHQDDLTSLRPPRPSHDFDYSNPRSSPPYQHSPRAALAGENNKNRHVYNDSEDSPRRWAYSTDEDDDEEEEDEEETARRRSLVRIRRLGVGSPRPPSLGHCNRDPRSPTPPFAVDPRSPTVHYQRQQQQVLQHPVSFKDQARSVVIPTNVREGPPRTTTTYTTRSSNTARQRRDETRPKSPILQGGPTADYQVQFKDQAQSLLLPHDSSASLEHIPMAIAVPVFDDDDDDDDHHHQPRMIRSRRPNSQRRRGDRDGYHFVAI